MHDEIRKQITPALFVRNEEFWIYYVLRPLLTVFDQVVLCDTGSEDNTVEVAKATALALNLQTKLQIHRAKLGDNDKEVGNAPNVCRGLVKTHWMLLVGGDEVWPEDSLASLIEEVSVIDPRRTAVGMVTGRNVHFERCYDLDTSPMGFYERDSFKADRLFAPGVRWQGAYPMEDHGLTQKVEKGIVHYLDAADTYFWHVRYTLRSRFDNKTLHRQRKLALFKPQEKRTEMRRSWLEPPFLFFNPQVSHVYYSNHKE